MSREPIRSQASNLRECAPLLEQMGCARNNLELGLAFHQRHRIAIHLKDRRVLPSNDEQCWSTNQGSLRARQVWPASARDYSLHPVRTLGSRHERCRRARTRTEQPDAVPADVRRTREPIRDRQQAPGEGINIATEVPCD